MDQWKQQRGISQSYALRLLLQMEFSRWLEGVKWIPLSQFCLGYLWVEAIAPAHRGSLCKQILRQPGDGERGPDVLPVLLSLNQIRKQEQHRSRN